MKKRIVCICFFGICLCAAILSSVFLPRNRAYPEPEHYTEADIPYDAMSEEDAQCIWQLWNMDDWRSVLAGNPWLQEAILAEGRCIYVNRLGGVGATKSVPPDARYLGKTAAPCEEYTTPQADLQTNFSPEGCEVYRGRYTVRSGDREKTFDMFFVQTEPGSAFYALMFVSSYTRPPYYDEGRWMLHPEGAAAP